MNILLIEDNKSTARSIELILRGEGIACEVVENGEEGLEKVKFSKNYDLLILDLMLPDISGYEVLSRIRAAKIRIPILILSGLSGVEEKIKGLGLGADDYLTKPFDKSELIARIKSLTRRSNGKVGAVMRFGKICIDLDTRTVKVEDKMLYLTLKEYSILEILAVKKDTVVQKATILEALYDEQHKEQPDPKIVDVFVCKLREKLYKASGGKNYIVTSWGRGYMFASEPTYDNLTEKSLGVAATH